MHGTARAIRIPEADKHDGLREKGGQELQPFQEQAEGGELFVCDLAPPLCA